MDKDTFQSRSLAAAKARRFAGVASPPRADAPPAPAPPAPASPEAEGRMADVTAKPVVRREAVAEGFLRLKDATLRAMDAGALPKGDAFAPARIAGIMAAKNTPQLVPLCHPIPLTSVEVSLVREERGVRCRASVVAEWKTGVEMEALAAVTAALLTVWDMAKALEKDATGNYPDTAIEAVRVLSKTKGSPERGR
ncbi:MAG TPA: cyclic pyranopterin monophosphate synthase MoaC [Candidatus Thermoplasmatota archaeon]|nr:cyclic pyranopterin monophosphate synthase MoaC [Candidatus Thermoplasmatota archaeon]